MSLQFSVTGFWTCTPSTPVPNNPFRDFTKGIKRMDVNKKTLKDQNQTFTYPIALNILNFLRDSKTFCDVTIVIDSQEFPAHKVNFKC